jgi:hypothetical protein
MGRVPYATVVLMISLMVQTISFEGPTEDLVQGLPVPGVTS